ncbi:hypothetical protein CYLTODRAFT_427304 [Cylindrobasidium torrendii FP15055 ss-10]|uniref:F-box domain-containing protein n=1 Tax=Cylindrobasidium torrendii FP15055 ss-10 TaxID=1314674 RepID=A0A0D7AX42_9AGAR|nr:hypothetical protein CYLTODRAFT_427304 [Cylindrobasidium torrendii FP15055 ss-10]
MRLVADASFDCPACSLNVHPILEDERANLVHLALPFDPIGHPEQKNAMNELVSDLEVARADLDARARGLERALDHIRGQRTRCLSLISNCERLFSPILSVPVDVPSIIFDFYIHCSDRSLFVLIDTAPLTLSHVCTHWRKLLLDSPRFWASRGMEYIQELSGQPPLDVFLGRSGSHAFPMKIFLRHCIYSAKHMRAVASTVDRWRTLELWQWSGAPDVDMTDFGFPRPADALDMLDYKLFMDEGDDTSNYLRPFEQCKSLRDLRLEVEVEDFLVDQRVPARLIDIDGLGFWTQLTTLHLNVDYPKEDVLGILRACSELHVLKFKMRDDDSEEDWMPQRGGTPIVMARLVELELPRRILLLRFTYRLPRTRATHQEDFGGNSRGSGQSRHL